MGRNELKSNLEEEKRKQSELNESIEGHIESAEKAFGAFEQMEGADEESKAIIEAAHSEAESTKEAIKESDVEAPSMELIESINANNQEAGENADTDRKNAEIAGEIDGDYESSGSNLESQLESSAEEFEGIKEDGEATAEEIESAKEAAKNRFDALQ